MKVSAEQVGDFLEGIQPNLQASHLIFNLPDDMPEMKYYRSRPSYYSAPENNLHNLWHVNIEIKGVATGRLVGNPAPFNATDHPGKSIKPGMSNGLPIGTMIVAKHRDEKTIYQVADDFAPA